MTWSRFEIKIVAALLVIAVIPLAASVVLVGQVIRASDSVAEGQTRRLTIPLERAADAYRALFDSRKRMFRLHGRLLAHDAELLAALAPAPRPAALSARLQRLVGAEEDAVAMTLLDRGGRTVAAVRRPTPPPAALHRELVVDSPLGGGGHRLRVVFYTARAPFDDFRALGQVQSTTPHLSRIRDELTSVYRVSFLILFGAVLLVATLLGLLLARRTTRRVATLAAATRTVAAGDLDTRVALRGRDELGELASSFNEMVTELKESRERIAYLEKIGAWQEIARRLAHEIKNPLTPIQLAVQQVHSKYKGEDPEFRRTLDDVRDIVTEEVNGLRRLVGEFSAFAKLPTVKPEPVDLNSLVDDFQKSHSDLTERARFSWTPLAPPARVLVDRMLMKHVFYNLVENAVQAAEESPRQGQVRVVLEARVDEWRHRVVLELSDDGPGMSEETRQRIFDPYFTTKERGTGLGLAIVKKIVLEHGGTIAASSRPGQGTRFTLALPRDPDEGGGGSVRRLRSTRDLAPLSR